MKPPRYAAVAVVGAALGFGVGFGVGAAYVLLCGR